MLFLDQNIYLDKYFYSVAITMAIESTYITNLNILPGHKITEHFWLVSWSTVRAKHIGKDIFASIKNIFGWELGWYTELLEEARKEAFERMVLEAEALGANAILNVRFSTSSVAAWAAEIYVYGTAVLV